MGWESESSSVYGGSLRRLANRVPSGVKSVSYLS
jgi:hypothetical protein